MFTNLVSDLDPWVLGTSWIWFPCILWLVWFTVVFLKVQRLKTAEMVRFSIRLAYKLLPLVCMLACRHVFWTELAKNPLGQSNNLLLEKTF